MESELATVRVVGKHKRSVASGFRLPADLYFLAKRRAARQKCSLNSYLCEVLTEAVRETDQGKEAKVKT